MQLFPLKLVNVVAESVLRTKICDTAMELGATGYTITEAEGGGSRGVRSGGMQGGSNVQIEFVVSEDVAKKLLKHIADNYFANYAIIAWVADVSVVRGQRYVK